MKTKIIPQIRPLIRMWPLPALTVLTLASAIGAPAQTSPPVKFSGTISDSTPASVMGPYEVRGPWSLTVKEKSGKADFTASLNMGRSDVGVLLSGGADLNNPADRNAHTHHITMVDGLVTKITGGLEITGPATITLNGAFPPPFGSTLPTLTIDVTGNTADDGVTYSNVTLLFSAPAAGHFGTYPLHGVVSSTTW